VVDASVVSIFNRNRELGRTSVLCTGLLEQGVGSGVGTVLVRGQSLDNTSTWCTWSSQIPWSMSLDHSSPSTRQPLAPRAKGLRTSAPRRHPKPRPPSPQTPNTKEEGPKPHRSPEICAATQTLLIATRDAQYVSGDAVAGRTCDAISSSQLTLRAAVAEICRRYSSEPTSERRRSWRLRQNGRGSADRRSRSMLNSRTREREPART
jgi:hypothetical protein